MDMFIISQRLSSQLKQIFNRRNCKLCFVHIVKMFYFSLLLFYFSFLFIRISKYIPLKYLVRKNGTSLRRKILKQFLRITKQCICYCITISSHVDFKRKKYSKKRIKNIPKILLKVEKS